MNSESVRVLMIDNYDSFTFNLVHYLEQLDLEITVRKNDSITLQQISELAPTHIVISPGPCTPNEAGISLQVIEQFKEKVPILGVCLGHQAIGQVFGVPVVQAQQIMHGKTSRINHINAGVFNGLPQGFEATRYHSLVLKASEMSADLLVTAWTEDSNGEIEAVMGIKHKYFPIEGVQFHPESVLSEFGMEMLERFILAY